MTVNARNISQWEIAEYSNAFDVYCIFMAIKLHFTDKNFDYGTYGPMTNYKFETFFARQNVCKQFARLARRFESQQTEVVENYIIANFIKNPKTWVTTLLTRQAQANYDEWRKLYNNFSYNFVEQFEKDMIPRIKERNMTFMQYIRGSGEGHPPFMTDIIRKVYPLWFLVGMNKVTGFMNLYDTAYKEDIFWGPESFLLRKTDAVVPDEDKTHTMNQLKSLIQSYGL